MEKVLGKNGLLRAKTSKKKKRLAKRLLRERIACRKKWIEDNPEKAEAERKARIEKYLMSKGDSINVPS